MRTSAASAAHCAPLFKVKITTYKKANLWLFICLLNGYIVDHQHNTSDDDMQTAHLQNRMRQRGISEAMIGAILTLGDWNARGDRLVLPERAIAPLLQQKREELKMLEQLARRGGASLVIEGETLITVYSNTKRTHS
ncbi:hypothetical protein [Pseudomonas jessenii]|uniref:hypothetical protein n=1 Tax=Pseudomonas jessenii TaxID=77298 RepID=UPI0011B500E0|nr:hypothetical protein [Pseudomonas jessenii]